MALLSRVSSFLETFTAVLFRELQLPLVEVPSECRPTTFVLRRKIFLENAPSEHRPRFDNISSSLTFRLTRSPSLNFEQNGVS